MSAHTVEHPISWHRDLPPLAAEAVWKQEELTMNPQTRS